MTKQEYISLCEEQENVIEAAYAAIEDALGALEDDDPEKAVNILEKENKTLAEYTEEEGEGEE